MDTAIAIDDDDDDELAANGHSDATGTQVNVDPPLSSATATADSIPKSTANGIPAPPSNGHANGIDVPCASIPTTDTVHCALCGPQASHNVLDCPIYRAGPDRLQRSVSVPL